MYVYTNLTLDIYVCIILKEHFYAVCIYFRITSSFYWSFAGKVGLKPILTVSLACL